ncbi:hypothetical protein [Actinoplanes italicus]|uniref:Uncharacterized protein n=1 Tax=Actinoplanes italicus TaxID=113567 RepID=A0A2T0K5N1_9ACTN|nr:hypothetical protein [Actinoplanes italicus]PRX18292.1 hypothetical protein CLV67_113126 [Actinoplanes italicus]
MATASGYCAVRVWMTDGGDLEHFEDLVLAEFAPLRITGGGMSGSSSSTSRPRRTRQRSSGCCVPVNTPAAGP